jgi:hypothetical protein
MMPHKSLYDKICEGTNAEYDWIDYTKRRYDEMCKHKNIFDRLSNPNIDDDDNEDSESECEDEEDEEQAETAEEEINMY